MQEDREMQQIYDLGWVDTATGEPRKKVPEALKNRSKFDVMVTTSAALRSALLA